MSGKFKAWLVEAADWMARPSLLVRVVIGVVVFIVFLVGSVEYTSRPNFCTTCHYMQPFYDSWAESSHSEVSCTTCHFPPGLAGTIHGKLSGLEQLVSYALRSYTRRKPWAEIDDASCLLSGCHSTRTLDGKVTFQNVLFDHQSHLGDLRRGKQLRCTSCHSQVVQGEHILVTETTCFLCHMKESDDPEFTENANLNNCETCHNWAETPEEVVASLRFDHSTVIEMDLDCSKCHANTVVGDGFVPEENCYNCHFEQDRLERYGETELMHKTHISDNKIECIQCHVPIKHRIERLDADSEIQCSTCHTSTHDEELLLFTGRPKQGSPHQFTGDPNPMLSAGLECSSCHLYHEDLIGDADVLEAGPSSCESCHGEGYDRLLKLWERGADAKLEKLSRELQRVERSISKSSSEHVAVAIERVQTAKEARDLVKVGKAVHNMQFADQLVATAYKNLNNALEIVKADFRLSGEATSNVVPSECANCHSAVEAIQTTFEGKVFPHDEHLVGRGLECKTCHSNVSTHGELVLSRQECNDCHHDAQRLSQVDNCGTCHETQQAFYAGTYLGRTMPDMMFEAGIYCEDCHGENEDIARPDPSVCVDCHDDEYEEMPAEWKSEIAGLAEELRRTLDSADPSVRQTETYVEARKLLSDLDNGSAHGAHNFDLTLSLLEEFQEALSTQTSL